MRTFTINNTYQEVTKLVSKQIIKHTFNKVYPYRELINNIRNVTRLWILEIIYIITLKPLLIEQLEIYNIGKVTSRVLITFS
jgi:hypothetical protein